MNRASSSSDLESGLWELSNSKLNPMLKARIHSGKRQLGSLLQQLDHIFVTGALFLKRNTTAQWWALIYLVCLHFWVFYILSSHSGPSNVGRSGAQISLENINNTGGVWLCCDVSFIFVSFTAAFMRFSIYWISFGTPEYIKHRQLTCRMPHTLTRNIQDFIASYFDELNLFDVVKLHWIWRESIRGATSCYLYWHNGWSNDDSWKILTQLK